jgi:non-ribosomal peptide synthetase component F
MPTPLDLPADCSAGYRPYVRVVRRDNDFRGVVDQIDWSAKFRVGVAMCNLASNLVAAERRMPDRVAVINGDVMTYAELDAATPRFATLLRALRRRGRARGAA